MTLNVDLARVEAAVNDRLGDKRAQIAKSIDKLVVAREEIRGRGITPTALGQLYMRAHDLKSLGLLCGSPVVSRLATAVCALLDDPSHLPPAQMGLVDDHLDAIRALFRQDVTSEEDPRAARLLAELERDLRER